MFELLAKSNAADGARFIKIDAEGKALAADATGHAIVRDTATQLEWAVAYATPDEVDHASAVAACAALDLGGHSDWRLPTRFELESILDLGRYNPAIDPDLFPNAENDWHWSSSPDASDPDCAWVVDFDYGSVLLNDRHSYAFVRAVRSVPASQ